MKAKRIMGFFLSLVMFTAYLPLNPIASYADGDGVKIDDNFPDENFKKYVKENFDNDGNGILSKDECDNVTDISVGSKSISSLKGIEHFKNLTNLNCGSNYTLEKLDVSKNTKLTNLDCSFTQLTNLDVSKNPALTELNCSSNKLTSLDVRNNPALKDLYCGSNKLTSLDVRNNPALTELDCNQNGLTSLDVSKNTKLTYLDCNNTKLTNLDVSNNPALTKLRCFTNELKELSLTNNPALTDLDCRYNNLSNLNVSGNTALKELSCEGNKLTSLDVRNNPALTSLSCFTNELTSLDVSNNPALTSLSCHVNKLTSLDVSNNPALTKLNCNYNPLASVKLINKNYEQVDLSPITYTVEVAKRSENLFNKLPQEFDKGKIIGEVTGASIESDEFTWDGKANTITFKYQLCENPNEVVNAAITVEIMEVETQPKLSYTEGEKLDLTELVVTLTDNKGPIKGLKKHVKFKDFKANGIKIDQVNGTALTLADSGKKIKLTKGNLSAETESLTVNKKVIGPVDPTNPNSEKPADASKYWTVTFETEDETKGTVDDKNTVYVSNTETKTLADITAPEVTAKEGYEFDKWKPALDKNTAIDKDLKVKAHFKEKEAPVLIPTDPKVVGPVDPTDPNGGKPADASKYYTVTFETEDETKGTVSAKNTVYVLKTETKTLADITAPEVTAKEGYEFDKWEPALDKNTAIDKDLKVKAYFKATGTPTPTDPKVVGPVDPTDPNGGKPADTSKYWTVTFETEDETKGTVSAKNTVYVLKTETKTLADITAPEVTAKEGYEFDKWEPTLDKSTAIDKDLTVKAHFKKVKEKSYNKKPYNKKQQVANNSKMPKTANSMNIELYTIFMILSVALLVIAVKKRKESY